MMTPIEPWTSSTQQKKEKAIGAVILVEILCMIPISMVLILDASASATPWRPSRRPLHGNFPPGLSILARCRLGHVLYTRSNCVA